LQHQEELGLNKQNEIRDTILKAPIDELTDMALETYNCHENRTRIAAPDKFRFITGIGRAVFARAFGFKTRDYYNNPEVCLRAQLQWKLYIYHIIQDSNYFDLDVGIDYATAYEPSFFGLESLEGECMEPTYGQPILKNLDEIDDFEKPDFYSSGLMPRVHEMYSGIKELAKDKLNVFFPGWARGPWSIATIIRGFQELFFDYVDNPDGLNKLMQFIVDSRIHWEDQRCRFLGISPKDHNYRWKYVAYRHNHNSDMFEDEVDGNILSPAMIRELIIPYTKQLSDYYGGIDYYHSCGNLTGFLEDKAYPGLNICTMQHISSWTDYKKAASVVPRDIVLQVSLSATEDVFGTDEHLKSRIEYFLSNSNGHKVDICADALYNGSWDTLERVRQASEIFREVANKYNLA
jgi:hypothetical protein